MRKIQPTIHQDVAEPSLLLDEKQTARFLGVSLSYLRKSRSEGTPGARTPAPIFVRVEGRVYYRRADLEDWVNDLESQRVC
jgi:hypothetical protein